MQGMHQQELLFVKRFPVGAEGLNVRHSGHCKSSLIPSRVRLQALTTRVKFLTGQRVLRILVKMSMIIVNPARIVIVFHGVLDRLFALQKATRSRVVARHLLLGVPSLYHIIAYLVTVLRLYRLELLRC